MFRITSLRWTGLLLVIGVCPLLLQSCSSNGNPFIPMQTADPIPVDWYWQNPLPQGNPLHDVAFINTNEGIAVGDVGTILITADGGATWSRQDSPTMLGLRDVLVTGTNTWTMVGDAGTIVQTTDRGVTWTAPKTGTLNQLNSAHFADTGTGAAVGILGTILRTTDGGATWAVQSSGTINTLNGVFFTDANRGIVVGDFGTMLRTTDGGKTWTAQNSGTTAALNSVFFTDASTGFVVGGAPGTVGFSTPRTAARAGRAGGSDRMAFEGSRSQMPATESRWATWVSSPGRTTRARPGRTR
ncbi:MAG: YCF48-related protein [Candidatus Krumholzibacteria bacterium]